MFADWKEWGRDNERKTKALSSRKQEESWVSFLATDTPQCIAHLKCKKIDFEPSVVAHTCLQPLNLEDGVENLP